MSEKKILDRMKVKYKGMFDLSDLYKFMWLWFQKNGYDWHETDYSDKQQNPNLKQIEIKWKCERIVNDYVDFWIEVDMFIFSSDAEVEKDGKKIKINSGEIEFRLTAVMEMDYTNEWVERPVLKFLRDAYDRFIIKGRLEQMEKELWDDTQEFSKEIKAFLDLYQY